MSLCVESPVRVPCPIEVTERECTNGNLNGDIHVLAARRRRILVQTDSGNVLGIEYDRADNVQAIKRRLQALLHLPMEQLELFCGDTILKSDLKDLKMDTPLLLTRSLQRSLSMPCLSPTTEFHMEAGPNHLIEVVGGLMCCSRMRMIIQEIVKAISCGIEPVPISAGLGGAYYFRSSKGENLAIIKPTDEEPLAPNNPKGFVGRMLGEYGLKKAIRVGETGVREVAAYLLDQDNFAKVPPTVLVEITHHVFHTNDPSSSSASSGKPHSPVTKLASCQAFVSHHSDASDLGCSGFSVAAVHRIGILDVRIYNTDRHAGNILVRKVDLPEALGCSRIYVNNSLDLVPIDHGLCLPESLEDPYFEWVHWPQASVPFSEEELDYIQRLDPIKDVEMLRAELPMLRLACLRMLILSTTFLKKAAAAGFCLAEIGELMSRDGLEEVSQLELFCLKARQEVESEIARLMVDDDNTSDVSFAEDELEDQFEFEQGDELGEEIGRCPSFQSDKTSMCSHEAGLFGSRSNKEIPEAFLKGKSSMSAFAYCMSGNRKHQDFSRVIEVSATKAMPWRMSQDVQAEKSCLESAHDEMLTNKQEIDLGLPLKKRTSCANGGRVMPKAITVSESLNSSSSKVTQPHGSLTSTSSSEDAMCGGMASCQISKPPIRAMSYRSASLSDRKQRSNFLKQRTFCSAGVSSSETLGKAKGAGSLAAVSFGDMSAEEWMDFMKCFEQILQDAFATRCSEPTGYRQRLGISLPVMKGRLFP